MNAEKEYQRIIVECKQDPNIIAFIPTAGRAKGFITKNSDWDVFIIVKEGMQRKYSETYPFEGMNPLSFSVQGYEQFKEYIKWDGPASWNRYNFVYAKPIFDKSKRIQKMLDSCRYVPSKFLKEHIIYNLSDYTNSILRSFKNHRDKLYLASRMDAIQALNPFLEAIFALHNGRIRPYNKYLEWELQQFPLDRLSISDKVFIVHLKNILDSGSIKSQKILFNEIERISREERYKEPFDDWTDDLDFMHKYRG